MLKKISCAILNITLGLILISPIAFAQTQTTTVEETTTKTITPPTTKKVVPPTTTTTTNLSVTTTKDETARQVMTDETLKKISNTLCTQGFTAYVGKDEKNLCHGKVTSPDIAYSCVWKGKSNPVYVPTEKGPCNLDYTEHRGSIVLTGVEAQCCVRTAKSK